MPHTFLNSLSRSKYLYLFSLSFCSAPGLPGIFVNVFIYPFFDNNQSSFYYWHDGRFKEIHFLNFFFLCVLPDTLLSFGTDLSVRKGFFFYRS